MKTNKNTCDHPVLASTANVCVRKCQFGGFAICIGNTVIYCSEATIAEISFCARVATEKEAGALAAN